jgi:hypothetical protein
MQQGKEKKYIPLAERNAQGIKNIIELSSLGRQGGKARLTTDLADTLDYLAVARNNRKITVVDEFFCLFALRQIIDAGNRGLRDHFLKVNSVLENLIKLNKISEEDRVQYEKCATYLKTVQEAVNKEKAAIVRKQVRKLQRKQESKIIDTFTAAAKMVVNAGLDIDNKIYAMPDLDNTDIELAIRWSGSVCQHEIDPNDILNGKYGDKFVVGKMLSARAAEKASLEFYRRYEQDVADLSIKQVTEPNNADWRICDLLVGKRPIDVKNTRYISEDRYVNHQVRAFKIRDDENVNIAGVLSRYLRTDILLKLESFYGDSCITVLGETSIDKLMTLKRIFESQYFYIDFSRPGYANSSFLPSWIYDYPSCLYSKRDAAIAHFQKTGMPDYDLSKRCNPIPSCIAAGIDLSKHWPENTLKKWEWAFFKELQARFDKHGLSLPILYMSLLSHFVKMIVEESDESNGYNPQYYKKLVHMDDSEHSGNPVGLCDPVKSIDSLIRILSILWKAQHELVKDIKYYRLSGFQILQGKSRAADKWLTLVAYCGGKNEQKKTNCGKFPLVVGTNVHCEACGRLICRECGFCSMKCPLLEVKNNEYQYHIEQPGTGKS